MWLYFCFVQCNIKCLCCLTVGEKLVWFHTTASDTTCLLMSLTKTSILSWVRARAYCSAAQCSTKTNITTCLTLNLIPTLTKDSVGHWKVCLATWSFYFYNCPLSSDASQHAPSGQMLNQNKTSQAAIASFRVAALKREVARLRPMWFRQFLDATYFITDKIIPGEFKVILTVWNWHQGKSKTCI